MYCICITFGDHSPLVETIQGFVSKPWAYLKQGDVVVFVFVFVCTCICFCICNCITFGDHSPLVETIQGFASKQQPSLEQADPIWRRFDTQDGSFACAAMI